MFLTKPPKIIHEHTDKRGERDPPCQRGDTMEKDLRIMKEHPESNREQWIILPQK